MWIQKTITLSAKSRGFHIITNDVLENIPELKDLDKSVIHDPPKEHRKYCGYPDQILDLKTSRLRAIDAFKAAKS